MNEQLSFDIGMRRYSEDVERAETYLALRGVRETKVQSARHRIAWSLIALATRLQPDLLLPVQRSAKPSAA